MKYNRIIGLIILVIVALVSLFSILFILDIIYHIPFFEYYNIYFYAGIVVVGGIVVTNLISSAITKKTTNVVGLSTAGALSFAVRIIGYILVAVVFFSMVKIDIGAALAAGGFAGLVLGLASQDVLGNIFGGIAIVGSHPFKIGDRITVSTWQYGLDAPAYPPKFYSEDFIIPGYTGVVTDVSLMYTSMLTDDNLPLKIPNSIMIQAAVFIQGRNDSRTVRTKFEVPKEIDPDIIIPELNDRIKNLEFIRKDPKIMVYETTLTTYILVVEALCKGNYEERDLIGLV
jgi:small-conductance mechanosensitive channel